MEILVAAEAKGIDKGYKQTLDFAKGVLENAPVLPRADDYKVSPPKHLSKKDAGLFVKGAEVYNREGHCVTCHQANGKGLTYRLIMVITNKLAWLIYFLLSLQARLPPIYPIVQSRSNIEEVPQRIARLSFQPVLFNSSSQQKFDLNFR